MCPVLHSIQYDKGKVEESVPSFLVSVLGYTTKSQLAVPANLYPPSQCVRECCS